jgi:uncharacterized membrane protein
MSTHHHAANSAATVGRNAAGDWSLDTLKAKAATLSGKARAKYEAASRMKIVLLALASAMLLIIVVFVIYNIVEYARSSDDGAGGTANRATDAETALADEEARRKRAATANMVMGIILVVLGAPFLGIIVSSGGFS